MEKHGGQDDGQNPAAVAGDREMVPEKIGKERNQSEVEPGNGRRVQGIGDASPENDVHIHQPVVRDGVTEGQGQEDQRKYGGGHPRRRNETQGVGQGVERRKGDDSQERPPRDPFELLLEQRDLRAAIGPPQDHRAGQKARRQVQILDAVRQPQRADHGNQRPA